MRSLTSVITGALSEAQKGQSSTGRQPGEGGSAQLPTASESERRAWLESRSPEETDKALRTSLASSLNVGLEEVSELRFPVSGGFRKLITGYAVRDPDGNRGAALGKVEAASIPAERDQAEEWLAILQIATAGGRKSEAAQQVALNLYTNALLQYPADVAKAACYRLATMQKWFPTLADVIELCDELAADRQHMRIALGGRR